MAIKYVSALNTISGRVARVPESYLSSPDFGKILVEVPEGTKDYAPEFFKPVTADEHRAKETTKRKAPKATELPVIEGDVTSDAENL